MSMAQLQGHFLKYRSLKEACSMAPELKLKHNGGVSSLKNTSVYEASALEDSRRQQAMLRAKRGPLSVSDVDKMVFNPQEGWDKGIRSL